MKYVQGTETWFLKFLLLAKILAKICMSYFSCPPCRCIHMSKWSNYSLLVYTRTFQFEPGVRGRAVSPTEWWSSPGRPTGTGWAGRRRWSWGSRTCRRRPERWDSCGPPAPSCSPWTPSCAAGSTRARWTRFRLSRTRRGSDWRSKPTQTSSLPGWRRRPDPPTWSRGLPRQPPTRCRTPAPRPRCVQQFHGSNRLRHGAGWVHRCPQHPRWRWSSRRSSAAIGPSTWGPLDKQLLQFFRSRYGGGCRPRHCIGRIWATLTRFCCRANANSEIRADDN